MDKLVGPVQRTKATERGQKNTEGVRFIENRVPSPLTTRAMRGAMWVCISSEEKPKKGWRPQADRQPRLSAICRSLSTRRPDQATSNNTDCIRRRRTAGRGGRAHERVLPFHVIFFRFLVVEEAPTPGRRMPVLIPLSGLCAQEKLLPHTCTLSLQMP